LLADVARFGMLIFRSSSSIRARGRVYLRTMLIHGARTVIAQLGRKRDAPDGGGCKLVARRNKHIAAVALALIPQTSSWERLFESLENFSADYMIDREQPEHQDRDAAFRRKSCSIQTPALR
jgi:hypothetical protein